jgi:hypothetical protein
VLGTTNVLSAPVLDEDGEYFGCLSVNDLLKTLYTRELQAGRSQPAVCLQLSRLCDLQHLLRALRHTQSSDTLYMADPAPPRHDPLTGCCRLSLTLSSP